MGLLGTIGILFHPLISQPAALLLCCSASSAVCPAFIEPVLTPLVGWRLIGEGHRPAAGGVSFICQHVACQCLLQVPALAAGRAACCFADKLFSSRLVRARRALLRSGEGLAILLVTRLTLCWWMLANVVLAEWRLCGWRARHES